MNGRPVSTSEKSIVYDYPGRVHPHVTHTEKSGTFVGKGGVPIAYHTYVVPNEKGRIVLLHGFSENKHRYPELVFNLMENGYSVYFLEHRGHGQSGRERNVRHDRVYVSDFDHYIEDVHTFVENIVKREEKEKLPIFGHSMGGRIAVGYGLAYPENVSGLLLSAPMMRINFPTGTERIALGLTSTLVNLGFGTWSAFPHGNAVEPKAKLNNKSTTSPSRYYVWRRMTNVPGADQGGPTFGWVDEAIRANLGIQKKAREISMPVIAFIGGDDRVVDSKTTAKFCKGVPNCQLFYYPDGKHDLYLERDEIRDPMMSNLLRFLENSNRR